MATALTSKFLQMSKVLGLDLGMNSIGWAIINTDTNQLESCGTRILPNKSVQQKKVRQQRRTHFVSILKCLHLISFAAVTLAVIDKSNWQFWLNLALTTFVATLTLLHQDKK
jgi:Holliday junction resolvasome RuvABC endonuclease subunit